MIRPWLYEEEHVFAREPLLPGVYGDSFKGTVIGVEGSCVIKVMNSLRSEEAEEFWEEIVTVGELEHKNILPLLGIVKAENESAIIRQFQRNGTLADALRCRVKSNRWPVGIGAVRLACIHYGVANGIAHLHSIGVVHGGLKPSNVCLGKEHRPLLTDFGCAKHVKNGLQLTSRDAIWYLAPEAYTEENVTKKADTYAFGVMMYMCLSESPVLFSDDTSTDGLTVDEIKDKIGLGIRFKKTDTISESCWELIQRCWRHEPDLRPEFVDILRELEMISTVGLSASNFRKYQEYIMELKAENTFVGIDDNNHEVMIASKSSYEKALASLSKKIVADGCSVSQTKKGLSECTFKCKRCNVTYKLSRNVRAETWEVYRFGNHSHPGKQGKPLIQWLEMCISEGLSDGLSGVKLVEFVRNKTSSDVPASTIYYHLRKNPNKDWNALWRRMPALGQQLQEAGLRFKPFITRKQDVDILESVAFELPGAKLCTTKAFLGLIFVDGCHLNDRLRSTLLTMVTLTADHILVPIAGIICPSEEKESYEKLFVFARDSLPVPFTIMSDQGLGITSAFNSIFGGSQDIKWVPCFFHVTSGKRMTNETKWELQQIVTCDHKEAYKTMVEVFSAEHSRLYKELKDVLGQMSYMENKYAGLFEMISDSPIEGFHSAISDLRDSEPLHLIEGLVMFTQRQLKRQLDALPKSQIHCQACINTIKYRKHRAKQLVCRQELDKFIVTETFVGDVTVEYRLSRCNGVLKCKCRGYERLGIPCRHMYSVLRHFSREQIPEVHAMHTVATIRQAIIDAHVTLNIGDLEESQIGLRSIRRRPGRPRKRRFKMFKEHQMHKSQLRCSACGKTGHTKRSLQCECQKEQMNRTKKKSKNRPSFRERIAEILKQRRARSVETRARPMALTQADRGNQEAPTQ